MPDGTLIPQWRVDGALTTLGPLRIGDGSILKDRVPGRPGGADGQAAVQPVETLGVFVDSTNHAYIPGSSLKGFLRSYLAGRIADAVFIDVAFGYQKETDIGGEGLGGAITVYDARIADVAALPESVNDPHWRRDRATCVASHVVIDRRTRTASDELLYGEEYVPAGIAFDVTLLVEGGDLRNWTADNIAGALAAALEGVSESPARLGASNAEGWGHVKWTLRAISRLTTEAIESWQTNPGSPIVDCLAPVDSSELLAAGRAMLSGNGSASLDFEIDLHLDGPFLVNDASRVKQPAETSEKPNHTPLRDSRGGPLLPASSIHGALRSQAERIARTIRMTVHNPAGARSERPPAVKTREDYGTMDTVSRLFGAPGWRSTIRLSDFASPSGSEGHAQIRPQEFVAIDRFTGGGADQLKFNAEAFAPTDRNGFILRGTLSLDVGRLALLGCGAGDWSEMLHLLVYTIRDLCEGDVPVGFGRSKGYGACTAKVRLLSDVAHNQHLPTSARDLIRSWIAEGRIA